MNIKYEVWNNDFQETSPFSAMLKVMRVCKRIVRGIKTNLIRRVN